MTLHEDNVIGIVGGMGPLAGSALFNSITRQTRASEDQQHLSVILMSFPKHIRDRSDYLTTTSGRNPAYAIVEVISRLERSGGKVIGIACNTSHAPAIYNIILQEIERMNSRVRLVNMPLETCRYIRDNHPTVRRIGLMTTNGTFRSGIYPSLLREWGYEAIVPDHIFQETVIHRMIYDPVLGIKSNSGSITRKGTELLGQALTFFDRKGADAVLLGCTDLSPVITQSRAGKMILVDSTEALAGALIREAIGRRSKDNFKAAAYD